MVHVICVCVHTAWASSVACSDAKAIPEPQIAEQQHCSPAFLCITLTSYKILKVAPDTNLGYMRMIKFIIQSSLVDGETEFDVTIDYPFKYNDITIDSDKWENSKPQFAHDINSLIDRLFNGNFFKKSDARCYVVLSSGKKIKLPDGFLMEDYSFHQ